MINYKNIYKTNKYLSNTRLVVTDKNTNGSIEATDIVQETHYEPFGLTLKGESDLQVDGSNEIKFQG